MRVVLDANVLASGIFWAGYPFRVLDLWARDRIVVLASEPILQEYAEVLGELGMEEGKQHLAQGWINFVFQHAVLIDVKSRVHASRDPDDDKYLACAIDGGAECIVSGDDDLLSLGSHVGIPILKPRQLIERVG